MTEDSIKNKLKHLYESAEAASSEGLAEEALKRCEQALDLLDFAFDEDTGFTHSDFLMLAGHACWEDTDVENSLHYYRQAYEMDPGRVDSLVAMGVALFHLCRFTASKTYLELASVEDPEVGEVWYYLALCALREQKRDLASLLFARAHELEQERWLRPESIEPKQLEDIINSIVEMFPKELSDAVEALPIVIETFPPEALLHTTEPPMDPLLLGLFEGVPLPQQERFETTPDANCITLFSDNISLIAGDKRKLVEELFVTLKQELAHYLGYNQEEMEERGLDY